jgi:hypothetical protein
MRAMTSSNELDRLEIEIRAAERDLASSEAVRLREQLTIVKDVLLDANGTPQEKINYLIERLGLRKT